MSAIFRTLLRQFETAEAIQSHLAATVEVQRQEPVTFGDLLAVIGADNVRLLDAELTSTGNTWLQQQLASNGVNLADGAYRAVIASLTEVPAPTRAAILHVGAYEATQWEAYGLPSMPTLAEIESAIAALEIDGHAISVAVNIEPGRESVAVSITAMAGSERCNVVHSFTSGRMGLTEAQQAFLGSLTTLVTAYRDEVL
jgi:hypothetical protein